MDKENTIYKIANILLSQTSIYDEKSVNEINGSELINQMEKTIFSSENFEEYEEKHYNMIYETVKESFSDSLANKFINDVQGFYSYFNKNDIKVCRSKINPLKQKLEPRELKDISEELRLKYLIYTKLYTLNEEREVKERLDYIIVNSSYDKENDKFSFKNFFEQKLALEIILSIPNDEMFYLINALNIFNENNEQKIERVDLDSITNKDKKRKTIEKIMEKKFSSVYIEDINKVLIDYIIKIIKLMTNKNNVIKFVDIFSEYYEVDYVTAYSKIKDLKEIYFSIVSIVILNFAKEIDDTLLSKKNKSNTFKDDSQYLVGILKSTNKELEKLLREENENNSYLNKFIEILDELFYIWISIIQDIDKQKTNKGYQSLKYILENKEQFDDILSKLPIFYKNYKIEDNEKTVKPLLIYIFFLIYDKDIVKDIFTMKGTNLNGENKSIIDHRTFEKLFNIDNKNSVYTIFKNPLLKP